MIVIGDKEVENGTVTLRSRGIRGPRKLQDRRRRVQDKEGDGGEDYRDQTIVCNFTCGFTD